MTVYASPLPVLKAWRSWRAGVARPASSEDGLSGGGHRRPVMGHAGDVDEAPIRAWVSAPGGGDRVRRTLVAVRSLRFGPVGRAQVEVALGVACAPHDRERRPREPMEVRAGEWQSGMAEPVGEADLWIRFGEPAAARRDSGPDPRP